VLLSLAGATRVDAADPVASSVDPVRLLGHIRMLSSDAFEGRLPGTSGEDKTVAYLLAQFKRIGLAPGNPDGTYLQNVALVGIAGTPVLSLQAAGQPIAMQWPADFVASTGRLVPKVSLSDSPLVFVGYGVQAPEYHWDDYKGLDAHGKTLVMLINDPPVEDPARPGQLDERMFKGRAMTYYGRWTYKYEIGARLGADAVLIVHETEPAAYDWSVVAHSWSGETFTLANASGNSDRVAVQGWITVEKARALFAQAGQDFDALKARARTREFRPVPLNASVSVSITNVLRPVQSRNVVALLPGTDPKLRGQYLIYTAHWDHLGRHESPQGTQIFHGAVDNASGVASMLEIARVFHQSHPRPARSILFMAVTGEEQGLLGSQYYAEHPLYPLNETLADLNLDVLGTWGRTRDAQVIGYGENSLEDDLARVLRSQQRVAVPDQKPEQGRYFRSDQFSFARVGVPGLYVDAGTDVRGKPAGYGEVESERYESERYHSPADQVYPDWDLRGAAEDATALYRVGVVLSSTSKWPEWRPDSEFRNLRSAPDIRHQ
jgi:Zn-dependent M28 family amino/carboxypeptidase